MTLRIARTVAIASLAAASLVVPISPASAFEPIEGRWEFEGGAVTVAPLDDQGHFQGTVVEATRFSSCVHPKGQVMWDIFGSGSHYSGEHVGFDNPTDCNPQRGFGATWDVSGTGDTLMLRFCSTPPSGGSTQCFDLRRLRRPQHQPIIFIPGFLGSVIECSSTTLWPNIPTPLFLPMRLADDGIHNFEDGSKCNRTAGPSGKIVFSAGGTDVYRSTANFLHDLPKVKTYLFAYDWRKSPGAAVDDLNELVEKARAETGHRQVVLYGHSMGGLVARWYIQAPERAEKVARVVTAGTPFWGSPKPYLALAYGWTTPENNGLDAVIPDSHLKKFAVNATGAYYLYPSPAYHQVEGGWWMHNNTNEDPYSLEDTYIELKARGANLDLLKQAHAKHQEFLDVYPSSGPEFQMIVGSGVKTIAVVKEKKENGRGGLAFEHGNGDGTVSTMSASAGLEESSLSGYVHYACRVDHFALTGSKQVKEMVEGYLLRGDPIPYPPRCER